jgi:NAD(P)-dependent dehydrogenase (short-subunit alcohol dehydrogenase family)
VSVLREDLLQGRTIALSGPVRAGIAASLAASGARVVEFGSDLDEETGAEWATAQGPLDMLVHEAGPAFASGGPDGLGTALEQAWVATRAAVTGSLIPGERGGKVALIAPAPQAGAYVEAARSGLENLARTLSVEWARYRITVTAITPGEQTRDEELGTLVSFLASAAGDYYSGCRLSLR